MFTPLTSHQDAHSAINAYLATSQAPAELKDKLTTIGEALSPVDRFVGFVETIYANKASADEGAITLCAQLAAWCAHPLNGFGGMCKEERGAKIMNACWRANEFVAPVGYDFGTEEDDPAPLTQYVIKELAEPELPIEEPNPDPGE